MNQWATRPVDERFWTLQEAREATFDYYTVRRESTNAYAELRANADAGEIRIVGPHSGIGARLTHHAFGQLCAKTHSPADYLRRLPATLAAQNLNHGLKYNMVSGEEESRKAKILFHADNGDHVIRAFTSQQYSRIWNWEVLNRLIPLYDNGWKVPPARPPSGNVPTRIATEDDIIASGGMLSVNVGDEIAPAGIYGSDHDMFVFMVHPDRHIDDGTDQGMHRGFFVWNSEVGPGSSGRASFGIQAFLLRHVCGNHIVWGAKNLAEVRVIHLGAEGKALVKASRKIAIELRRYADESASDTEQKIGMAKMLSLGDTKEDVLDALFGKQVAKRRDLEAAYDLAEENVDTDGDPRTAWGLAQGLTRLSQQSSYADERASMDRAAARVVEFAF